MFSATEFIERMIRKSNIVVVEKYPAVNWSVNLDAFTQDLWVQNNSQYWMEKEFVPSADKNVWQTLPDEVQETFMKALMGLTGLDTEQGGEGMPLIALHVKNLQAKSVLSFMGAMEHVHAKSYSNIFTTLSKSNDEIKDLFDWADTQPQLQYKMNRVGRYYKTLWRPEVNYKKQWKCYVEGSITFTDFMKLGRTAPIKRTVSQLDLYMAMAASVLLESFLFYSGFFYPLYLAGGGYKGTPILTASGEIVKLIVRDESIHGLYVGMLAQQIYADFDDETKAVADKMVNTLIHDLMDNEIVYTQELYAKVGLVDEVTEFLKYNANKALMTLGKDPLFSHGEVNPIVLNSLSTVTVNHDFFSMKGNSYFKAENVVKITPEELINLVKNLQAHRGLDTAIESEF